jgi:hypothetical protein
MSALTLHFHSQGRFGRYLCQGEDDSRIGHHGVGPSFVSSSFKQIEIFGTHLHIHLDGSFHALLYR